MGDHDFKQCISSDPENLKCANCGGNHSANSSDCAILTKMKENNRERWNRNKAKTSSSEAPARSKKNFPYLPGRAGHPDVTLPKRWLDQNESNPFADLKEIVKGLNFRRIIEVIARIKNIFVQPGDVLDKVASSVVCLIETFA